MHCFIEIESCLPIATKICNYIVNSDLNLDVWEIDIPGVRSGVTVSSIASGLSTTEIIVHVIILIDDDDNDDDDDDDNVMIVIIIMIMIM